MHGPKLADKNTPYWWEAAPVMPLPPQPLARTLDVAIVGAGYAGLSAGLVLAREGRSVGAFDAMNPGEGASSRNGGIASGSIKPGFDEIVRQYGVEKALAVETEGKRARLDALCQTLGVEHVEASALRYQLFHRAASAVMNAR